MNIGSAKTWTRAMPVLATLLFPTDVLADARSPVEQLLGNAQTKVQTEAVHSLVSRLENEQHGATTLVLQSQSSNVITQVKLENGPAVRTSSAAPPSAIELPAFSQTRKPEASPDSGKERVVIRPEPSSAKRELPAASANAPTQPSSRAENVSDKRTAESMLAPKPPQPEIAEEFEVALIEAVIGNSAGTEFMGYVRVGRVIRLAPSQTIVLSYVTSCLRETITGGTVTVGTDWSEVHSGGEVVRLRGQCDAIHTLVAAAPTHSRKTF